MQNKDFVFGFRLTCKQNHLRFSQVVFPFFARPKGCALTSYSAFSLLHSAFNPLDFALVSSLALGESP